MENTLVVVEKGKTKKKTYKTYKGLNKAAKEAVKTGKYSFVAKRYDDGAYYIWNDRTKRFVCGNPII